MGNAVSAAAPDPGGDALEEALRLIRAEDPTADGRISGNVLELSTRLTRTQAAACIVGLRPPIGTKFQWLE